MRDYRRHFDKAVQRWKPASVNLGLAALDSFYAHPGLGRAVVRREELAARAPRALPEEQQRRLLRLAERVSARDWAIVVVLLYTGPRLAELVVLDVDDVTRTRRTRASSLCAPARGCLSGGAETRSCARSSRRGSPSARRRR